MAELEPNQAWPIAPWGDAYVRWDENDAWWTGDTERLAGLYDTSPSGRATHRVRGELHSGGLVGWASAKFWGRPIPAGERRTRVHIPAAADVASLSSDLLFAEPPSIDYPDDAKPAEASTKRLAEIATSDQALLTYSEGGELTAAFGASALTLAWDQDTTDHVWVTPVGPDVTVPEFRFGKLIALNLWSEYVDGTTYYRHVERHEIGLISHTLYRGTSNNLGVIVPLEDRPETAPLAKLPGLTDHGLETGIDRLTAAWWPNAPARQWRRKGTLAEAGRSDYSGGMLGLFDSLDEAWSSWMRDLALGRARLIVDQSALESNGGVGDGASFDLDREVFQALNLPGLPDKPLIQAEQFQIRVDEHERTTQALYRAILAAGGYSALDKQSDDAVAITATESNTRGQSRERTRDKKALYAKQVLAEINRTAMLLDGVKFPGNGGGDFGPIEVTFPPSSQQDPLKVAQTIAQLRTAQAASIKTGVRLANPTWKQNQVDEEVAEIQEERSIPDPTRAGAPNTDPEAARQEAERLGLSTDNEQRAGDPARG